MRGDTATLVLVEDTKVTNKKVKHRCKSVNEYVIKFKSMKCKNRRDRRRVVKNKQEKIIKNEK